MENARTRSEVIDLCRGLAILLVIYGHAIEVTFFGKEYVPVSGFFQWQVIYSFHMALFFVLSGVVHKKKPLMKVLITSVSLILFAMGTHLAVILFTPQPSLWKILRPLFTLQSFSLIVTWYLVAHAWVIIFVQLFIRMPLVGRVAGIVFLFAIFVVSQIFNGRLFQVHALPMGVLFYGLGAWAASARPLVSVRQYVTKRMLVPLVCLGVVFTGVLAPLNGGCVLEFAKHCSNHKGGFAVMFVQGRYGYIPLFFITALVGTLVVFGLARFLDDRASPWLRAWLCSLGQSTISLLVINGVFLAIVEVHLSSIFDVGSSSLETILWAAGLTAVQLLMAPLVQPLVKKAVKLCDAAAEACVRRVRLVLPPRLIGLLRSYSG